MNDLSKFHGKYLELKAKIDGLDQAIQNNGNEIQALEQPLAETQQRHQEIDKRLKNADFHLAKGELNSDEFLSLKQEYYDLENRLKSLEDAVQAQKNAGELLSNERSLELRTLFRFKHGLAGELSKKIAEEIAGSVGEHLKRLFWTVLTTADPAIYRHHEKDELFKFIGVELCERAFGESRGKISHIDKMSYAGKKVDEMIAELS